MPRRNNIAKFIKKPLAHTRDQHKTRYQTRQAAEKEIARRQLDQFTTVELYTYQGNDGGWYLTSHPQK